MMFKLMPACRVRLIPCVRLASGAANEGSSTSTKKSKPAGKSAAPAARSDAPTDSSKYNVPDYYAHDVYSYYDIDAQAHKYRLPQPSKFAPLAPKK